MVVVMTEETFFPAMEEEEDDEDEKRNSACLGKSLQCLNSFNCQLFFQTTKLKIYFLNV